MISNRIIPVLLISGEGVIKTKNFKEFKYLGDPINIVKIFNEKEIDELTIFDINASLNKKINFKLIEKISRQCRMPLCYGGGVKNIESAKRILSLGVEKISFSSLFYENIDELVKIINVLGSQSVVITLDFKTNFFGSTNFFKERGRTKINMSLDEILEKIKLISPGELILNSISNDGCRSGYDLKILSHFTKRIDFPITISGGASGINSFFEAIKINNNVGCAASSVFSLKEPLDAVLIQYLSKNEKFLLDNFKYNHLNIKNV